jgi:CelD/BcsL family acetyltransferase involved in cellulose biosynthesis
MSVYEVAPLQDERWSEFLQLQPMSSVFHTPGWLKALSMTHGYEVRALTTTKPGQPLDNGLVFCRIKSWLTGSRIVSLPFSDHCDPLVNNPLELEEVVGYLREAVMSGKTKYCELRPMEHLDPEASKKMGLGLSSTYCLHMLDLQPTLDELYRSFHKSCVQRKIQRAEREELTALAGRAEEHLAMFYRLLVLTRRRHCLPPQPLAWFRNLIRTFGAGLLIRIALKDGRPIAGILTLTSKGSVVYKYGCSDSEFHNLGGMPFLFWHAIREAKEQGASYFDFGRSDTDNPGLISFKDNWGGTRRTLAYYRYPAVQSNAIKHSRVGAARKAFSSLPSVCLTTAGRLLYRHIG